MIGGDCRRFRDSQEVVSRIPHGIVDNVTLNLRDGWAQGSSVASRRLPVNPEGEEFGRHPVYSKLLVFEKLLHC